MRTWIIGVGVTILTAALGVGAAYGGSELMKNYAPPAQQAKAPAIESIRNAPQMLINPEGMGGRMRSGRNGPKIGGRLSRGSIPDSADEITIEEASRQAEAAAAKINPDLKLAEVMEFDNNFYAVFVEKDTGRGAVEILVDRYGRGARLEQGPAMMWNLKYGQRMHRSGTTATDNTVTLAEARQAAQEFLDSNSAGATLNEGGYAFYGYYSFDYSVNGKVAGMLSVNGISGRVWPHTWHGAFLQEEEVAQ